MCRRLPASSPGRFSAGSASPDPEKRNSIDSSAAKSRLRQTATHREYRAHHRWDFQGLTATTALASRRNFHPPPRDCRGACCAGAWAAAAGSRIEEIRSVGAIAEPA